MFYDSILHGGHVKHWSAEEADEELRKFFGVESNQKYIQNYIPFELQIPIKRNVIIELEKKKSKRDFGALFKSQAADINEAAHDALFVLESELAANENLEYEVSKRLEREPGKELFIEAPFTVMDQAA